MSNSRFRWLGGLPCSLALILWTLALAGVAACDNPLGPTPQELLEGDWTWVQSIGGIAGETRTPASTGESMRLRFRDPNTVEWTRNGVLEHATTYQIFAIDDSGNRIIEYSEPLMGSESQTLSVGEDLLVLIDDCCDRFAYTFERAL